MPHESFEWDIEKAKENFLKHSISFDEAAAMLSDPFAQRFHVEEFDEEHSENEERWHTTGSYPYDRHRVFVVTWTPRATEQGASVTRIITARLATTSEQTRYREEISHG